MTKYFLTLVVLWISINTAAATTYYIDASSGSDSWPGTAPEPQAGNGPWKTLLKAGASTFLPGDRILLRCGRSWQEPQQLVISSSGSLSNPITYGNYGTDCGPGNLPTVNAATRVTGWTRISGSLYAAPIINEMNQVFVDGQPLKQARYPQDGFLRIAAATVINPAYTGSGCSSTNMAYNYVVGEPMPVTWDQVVGAYVHIRVNDYIIDDFLATGYNAADGKISLTYPYWYTTASCYAIQENWGYFLTNRVWMLDASGGWAIEDGQLYVRLADGSDPGNRLIEASVINNDGIVGQNRQHIHIDGVAVKNAGGHGVKLTNPIRFQIANLQVSSSGDTGIGVYGYGTPASDAGGSPYESGTVQNSVIADSARRGIFTDSQANTQVLNNIVTNTGMVGRPMRSYGAIWVRTADNSVIQNNRISRSGYIGIQVQHQENLQRQNALVQNNLVEDSCQILDDCGAIYIQGFGGVRIPSFPVQDSRILNNLVVNAIGNPAGRGKSTSAAQGIYLDDYTNQVLVSGNTSVNADWGVFMHNAFNNTIEGNTTYLNRKNEIAISESGNYPVSPKGVVHGNIVRNNYVFPRTGFPALTELSSFGTGDFGYYDYNRYSFLYSDVVARVLTGSYTLTDWQQLKGMDTHSTAFSRFGVASFKILNTIGQDLIVNNDFNAGTSGWVAWNSASDGSIEPGDKCVFGGCVKLVGGSTYTLLISNSFPIYEGKTYLLSFDMRAVGENQPMNVFVRRNGTCDPSVSPNDAHMSLGVSKLLSVGSAWERYAYVFTGTKTIIPGTCEVGAQVHIQVSNLNQTAYVDNVYLKEVNLEINDPGDDSVIAVNRKNVADAVACPVDALHTGEMCNQYMRFDTEAPVTYGDWPLMLPAMGSRILVWTANPMQDTDRDGVADTHDICPRTVLKSLADESGCSYSQRYPADLAIALVATPEAAVVGDTITYSLTVANNGPSTALEVNATGTLPGCAFGNLASGASVSCIRSVIATTAGKLKQTMAVSAAEADPVASNNSVSTSINVKPRK